MLPQKGMRHLDARSKKLLETNSTSHHHCKITGKMLNFLSSSIALTKYLVLF